MSFYGPNLVMLNAVKRLTASQCNGIYLHASKPPTLAPPTEHQFKNPLEFLLSPQPDLANSPSPSPSVKTTDGPGVLMMQ